MAEYQHLGDGTAARHARPRRGGEQPLRASWDPERRAQVSAAGRARSNRRPTNPLRHFTHTWGWRAYAIPVLLLVTGFVVVDAVRTPDPTNATESASQQPQAPDVLPAPANFTGPIPAMGELPAGGDYEASGEGTFRVVGGGYERVGERTAKDFTYTVEVENGINTTAFGGDDSVAHMVDATLTNPKSWTADGNVAFSRIDSGDPDFRVSLATPATVRDNCGYDIKLETSCYNSTTERVYLNLSRWVRGALSFAGDVGSYRQYQINHEVGHAIGHPEHLPCPADGGLAPVMMQQTLSLKNSDLYTLSPEALIPDNDDSCHYNPWPFPEAR